MIKNRLHLIAACILTLMFVYVAAPLAHADITSNLNIYYTADEGSGTALTNTGSAGSTRNATLSGSPAPAWTSPGKIGASAVNFTGGSGKGQTNAVIDYSANITISAWVRPSSGNTSYNRIAETGFGPDFYLGVNTNGAKYDFIVNNNAGSGLESCIGGTPTNSQWDLVTGVFDGTNEILYVNGVQVCSHAATTPANQGVFMTVSSGSNAWHGDIDDIRYYTRALSAADVTELYAYPPSTAVPSPLLSFVKAFWIF